MSSEKLESLKIAFFTKELDLTPKEAQNFWPIYNEYSAKKKELREKRKQRPDLSDVSEEEALALIDVFLNHKQNELDLDRNYTEQFKKVLPAQKVMMTFMLERKFKEEVLKDVRRRLKDSQ